MDQSAGTAEMQEGPVYGTKMNLMVRLQIWRSEKYVAPLHCHYFQVTLTYSGSIC